MPVTFGGSVADGELFGLDALEPVGSDQEAVGHKDAVLKSQGRDAGGQWRASSRRWEAHRNLVA